LFRSTDDTSDLEQEDAEHVREIADMLDEKKRSDWFLVPEFLEIPLLHTLLNEAVKHPEHQQTRVSDPAECIVTELKNKNRRARTKASRVPEKIDHRIDKRRSVDAVSNEYCIVLISYYDITRQLSGACEARPGPAGGAAVKSAAWGRQRSYFKALDSMR
jgi:hypothetical protein